MRDHAVEDALGIDRLPRGRPFGQENVAARAPQHVADGRGCPAQRSVIEGLPAVVKPADLHLDVVVRPDGQLRRVPGIERPHGPRTRKSGGIPPVPRAHEKGRFREKRSAEIGVEIMPPLVRVVRPLVHERAGLRIHFRRPRGIVPSHVSAVFGRIVDVGAPVLLAARRQPILGLAMVSGSAVPRDHLNHPGLCVSVFGVHTARNHGNLLQRFHVGAPPLPARGSGTRASVLILQTHAVNVDQIVFHLPAADHPAAVHRHARFQRDELRSVSKDRSTRDILGGHHVPALRLVRLHGGRFRHDDHLLQLQLRLAKLKVHRRGEVGPHLDFFLGYRMVPDHGRGHLVYGRVD